MSIIKMDKTYAPASREHAQRLYDKNTELENKLWKSAQARIPSDPNAWQLMRENFEAIILEDHEFSEQHNIEYALWQLHYKRIEELRAHLNAVLQGSTTSQGMKGSTRPDRLRKKRMQLKVFLSEATGFYHDLILKVRAKYGLPLTYSSEDSNIIAEKDLKKSATMKKGLISCHCCLIYLGDLSRYKGLYGEGHSKAGEHAVASSYYLQASSLWPSSGNPHHQLAILAFYSDDDLVAVYRYFRSLAVDSPSSTARDNLIVAFEKNRRIYSQLPGDVKASAVKALPSRVTGRGRSKGDIKLPSKDNNTENTLVKKNATSIDEKYKTFSIRFVRLNGIIFTCTSLETFGELLYLVSHDFCELLSSGPEEEPNLGADDVRNRLFIVRLITILIFTVHNVNKETEGQTCAEILQGAALVQNAFTAAFEIVGHILERCQQLCDPSSSYLLPGILVFVEWLACCRDIAAGNGAEEKQATIRLKFWNHCISFLNKLLSIGSIYVDDYGDDNCFYNMSRYKEEGGTENRLALPEDFELRGFLPLLPAQAVLDFSRKLSFESESSKERKARVERILAAGKALINVVKLDEKTLCFDLKVKKFILGVESPMSDDFMLTSYSSIHSTNDVIVENQVEKKYLEVVKQSTALYMEEEEEEEVIVFKPALSEKRAHEIAPKPAPCERLNLGHTSTGCSVSAPPDNLCQLSAFDGSSSTLLSTGSITLQIQSRLPKCIVDEEASLSNDLKAMGFLENGNMLIPEVHDDVGIFHPAAFSIPMKQSVNHNASGMFQNLTKGTDTELPTNIDTVPSSGFDILDVNTSSAFPTSTVRHFGPPPGFGLVPHKQANEQNYGSELTVENPMMDAYSWLDQYQLPTSMKVPVLNTSIDYLPFEKYQDLSNSVGLARTASFPFPGKHDPAVTFEVGKQNIWQDYQPPQDLLIAHHEPQQQQIQFTKGNQQCSMFPEEYQGQSIWTDRYIV